MYKKTSLRSKRDECCSAGLETAEKRKYVVLNTDDRQPRLTKTIYSVRKGKKKGSKLKTDTSLLGFGSRRLAPSGGGGGGTKRKDEMCSPWHRGTVSAHNKRVVPTIKLSHRENCYKCSQRRVLATAVKEKSCTRQPTSATVPRPLSRESI